MTKGVNKEKLTKYMTMTRQRVLQGRAKEALQVKRAQTVAQSAGKASDAKERSSES